MRYSRQRLLRCQKRTVWQTSHASGIHLRYTKFTTGTPRQSHRTLKALNLTEKLPFNGEHPDYPIQVISNKQPVIRTSNPAWIRQSTDELSDCALPDMQH